MVEINETYLNKMESLLTRLESAVTRMEMASAPASEERAQHFEMVLREAVDVLEKTKNSFHSRQLKNLRVRLVSVLNNR